MTAEGADVIGVDKGRITTMPVLADPDSAQ
jgi:hypothetical protein